jgi:spore coat protein CotH
MKTLILTSLALTLFLAAPHRPAAAEAKPEKAKKTEAAGDEGLFAKAAVFDLKIEIPSGSLELLRANPKDYVRGTIREGDKAYADAGIRYKGNSTAPSNGSKPAFTVKFNEFISGQQFHGQRKIVLESCTHDPTFLNELLACELYRAAGVPAPRCTFARVQLNGRDLGLYVLAEGINRDFLSRFFDKSKGNLYEGDDRDVTSKLDKDSGDERKDQPDLAALAEAARGADAAQRWQRLEKVLDLDRFLSFAAVEVFTWHTGGYCLGTNKYRIYHDPSADRMVFLPHGLDNGFTKPDGPLQPEWRGLVARAVLDSAEGRRLYRERMSKLLATAFKTDALQAKIDELATRLRPILAAQDAKLAKATDTAIAQLRERVAQRAQSLQDQLKTTTASK